MKVGGLVYTLKIAFAFFLNFVIINGVVPLWYYLVD